MVFAGAFPACGYTWFDYTTFLGIMQGKMGDSIEKFVIRNA
jgi:hypothetical protein